MKKLLVGFLMVAACGSPTSQQATEEAVEDPTTESEISESLPINRLHLYKVDNAVKVYMDDSLIFDSGYVPNNPELDIPVDLTDFINGYEVLKIELYNGIEPYNSQADSNWEVRYDLFLEGELVDFAHEGESDGRIGNVYEVTYEIIDWIPES